jgi:predicted outer membrane repeat protein
MFLDNTAEEGGAIYAEARATIEGCVFEGNAGRHGAALDISGSEVRRCTLCTCCLFWRNDGGIGGGFWDCGLEEYLEADPLFCDPSTGDFGLKVGSPCLPGGYGSCGTIGAEGLGCAVDPVLEATWGKMKALFR